MSGAARHKCHSPLAGNHPPLMTDMLKPETVKDDPHHPHRMFLVRGDDTESTWNSIRTIQQLYMKNTAMTKNKWKCNRWYDRFAFFQKYFIEYGITASGNCIPFSVPVIICSPVMLSIRLVTGRQQLCKLLEAFPASISYLNFLQVYTTNRNSGLIYNDIIMKKHASANTYIK